MEAGVRPAIDAPNSVVRNCSASGKHEPDQIAARQTGRPQRAGAAPGRLLQLGVRTPPIAVARDETVAGVGARPLRQRLRERP